MEEITNTDSKYPINLAQIPGSPETIFVKGNILPIDQLSIAIVGSRDMSEFGRGVAYRFAFDLAKLGVTIVSGLALGIDTIAHKGALAAGGRTIAVLGGGFDHMYPKENDSLALQIIKNGALVSEFAPDISPKAEFFLARNRIISGLSLGVFVVEGKRRSGTLSTAAHAGAQGREVFVLGKFDRDALDAAPNFLAENGATIIDSPADIIRSINIA